MPTNKSNSPKRRVKIKDFPESAKQSTAAEMKTVKGGAQMNMQFQALSSLQPGIPTDKPRNPDTASK